MICLHRLKGEEFWLNHRIIETIEARPDTIVTLTNEHKYVVNEKPVEIREMIQKFEYKIFNEALELKTENE